MATFALETMSASKMRRNRQTATKHRLYAASLHDQKLDAIHAQMALVTSTLDGLCHFVTGLYGFAGSFPLQESVSESKSAESIPPPGITSETESTAGDGATNTSKEKSVDENSKDESVDDNDKSFPFLCRRCHKALPGCRCEWELCEGAPVVISGLHTTQYLNGEVAVVQQPPGRDGRCSVRLRNGERKKVHVGNLETNPRDIASGMAEDIETSISKADSALEQLKANASHAQAEVDSLSKKIHVLDSMQDCPSGVTSKVDGLLCSARSKLDTIQAEITDTVAERAAILSNGRKTIKCFLADFMQHVEARH